jgi:BMFP domain-containing protein YqiC
MRRIALLDWLLPSKAPSSDPSVHALMDKAPFLDDLQQRLSALVEATPAADLQKNLKALLTQQFARLELVTREEFDTQAKVLARARAKLDELEARLAALEVRR